MGTRKSTGSGITGSKTGQKKNENLKVGSSKDDAAQLVGENDFGAKETDVVEREYVSRNTRRADPGAAQARSNEEQGGVRESGVGGDDAGPGSSSGGDLDPQFIGIAGGAGLADDIEKEHHDGPDDSDGSSAEMASGRPAQGRSATAHSETTAGTPSGAAVRRPGDRDIGPQGADAVSRQGDGNDDHGSFVGEISSAEADGRDDRGE